MDMSENWWSALGRAQPYFHWQYSGVAIAILVGLWGVMIGLGVASDATDWIKDFFNLAYVCLVIAAIYGAGFWLTSKKLTDLRQKYGRARKPAKKAALLLEIRKKTYLTLMGILSGLAIILVFTYRLELSRELSTFSGILTPANDAFVPACGGAKGREAILLFGTAAAKFDKWPAVILRVNGKNRITMDKDSKGNISVSATIFSSDGKIVADVFGNVFKINRNNIFREERPDESTLKVIDQNDEQALYIRYINKHEIQFDAKLWYPDSGSISVMNRVSDLCLIKIGSAPLFNVNTHSPRDGRENAKKAAP